MLTIFFDENNLATICCPKCGKSKEIDASPYLGENSSARITLKFTCSACDCGHKSCRECREINCSNSNSNVFQLERRKFYRKKVDLPGTLFARDGRKQPVRIVDLSRTGLKVSILSSARLLTPGQRFRIEFTLDDARQSCITKEIIVRSTEAKIATGEFTDHQSYDQNDKMIGFYLMKR